MRKHRRKRNWGITLLVWGMMLIIQLITVIVAAISLFIVIKTGLISKEWIGNPNTERLVLLVIEVAVVVSVLVGFACSVIPINPYRNLIRQLNRLADGDFSVRLSFGKVLGKIRSLAELEDSFNRMAEELGKTEMLRNDFINNFSHEFKTPIVSIAGFAKILKHGNLTPEQQEEYLNVIEDESLRLSCMATNVLDLTRIENQAILTDLSTFNLSEQIRSCILLLESKWTAKDLNWSIEFQEYQVRANEELLKQVWINLIDNAIKFSDEGGTITITIETESEHLVVCISNSGIPIAKEAQRKIFKKFYQADESHGSEGNGIGLAIVKRVVELHHGHVGVRCEEGQTTFMVELPECAEK